MFDLFRSRDKVVRILLGGILLLVSLSMLTYLVPSFNSGSSSTDQVVAEVGEETITAPMVAKVLSQFSRNGKITPDMLQRYVPTMVDDMILQRAMAYEAKRLGYKVSDAEMRDAIKERIPGLFPDGQFLGVEAYTQFLAEQNIRLEDFEADLRRTLLITRLLNTALEGTLVTPTEIEDAFRQRNETIKVEYAKLTADKYVAESQPSLEDVQSYYRANQAQFQTGERKNLVVLVGDAAKIESATPVSDAELQQVYNANKDAFRLQERVRVRHILFKTTGKPATEEPKLKAQAEDVLKQLKAGGDFAALAKKFSEDPSSANNEKGAGELPDWITRGQTVGAFENVAFTLKPNELSGVVKTEYGYHIIQPLAHEQARMRPYEEVKTELASQYHKMRVSNVVRLLTEQGPVELKKNAAHPDQVAAKLNAQLVKADNWAPGAAIQDVGPSPDFDQAVAALKVGEVSAAVTVAGDKVAFALLTGVVASRPTPFEEVAGQIKNNIAQGRAAAALQKHAMELAAAAKTGDFAKAAKAAGAETKTSEAFARTASSVAGIGSASYLADAFGKPEGTVVGPMSLPDGTMVAKVVSRTAADMSQLAAQRDQVRDEIKSRRARDRETLFEEGIREDLKKRKKIKVHTDVLQRVINGLGSSS